MISSVTARHIEEAQERIAPYAHRTPVFTSRTLNHFSGSSLFFKCENFQKVGAFKFRGACNALLQLNKKEQAKGVATHSSGNHAQAVALAAKMQGIPAYIVMPSTAPHIKKAAVLGYGGKIIECEPTLEARETTLQKVVEETGAHEIHPFNDERVIAGQATCAKEMLEDHPDLDLLIAPVGGGGLLSGTALSSQYFGKGIKVYAGEPAGADDAFRSFAAGKIIPSENPHTIADGLLTSLGSKTFPIISELVCDIFTVTDSEIIAAMRMVWERMKIVIEPSSAVPLAAIFKNPGTFSGKKTGVILSGGNVDLGKLPFSKR